MALYADRVKDTTTSTGTTAGIVLNNEQLTGYRSFATAFGSSSQPVAYCIVDSAAGDWEVGVGTFNGTTSLTRTTVLSSSAAGSLVNFAAGTKEVFCTAPAQYLQPNGVTGSVQYNNAGVLAGYQGFKVKPDPFLYGLPIYHTVLNVGNAGTSYYAGDGLIYSEGVLTLAGFSGKDGFGLAGYGSVNITTGVRSSEARAGATSPTLNGDIVVQPGLNAATGSGGDVYIKGGSGNTYNTIYNQAGKVEIRGGDNYTPSGSAGGDILIKHGYGYAGYGTIYIGDSNPSYNNIMASSNPTTSAPTLGFFGASPIVKPTPNGSGTGSVLSSLVASLNSLGLINSTNLTNITVGDSSGSGTSAPGGLDTYIQFNNNNALGGSDKLTYNSTTDELKLGTNKIGFFGTAPAVKPFLTGSTTQTQLNSVIAALGTLGLVRSNVGDFSTIQNVVTGTTSSGTVLTTGGVSFDLGTGLTSNTAFAFTPASNTLTVNNVEGNQGSNLSIVAPTNNSLYLKNTSGITYLQFNSDPTTSQPQLSFFGGTPAPRVQLTGSGTSAVLNALITALGGYGYGLVDVNNLTNISAPNAVGDYGQIQYSNGTLVTSSSDFKYNDFYAELSVRNIVGAYDSTNNTSMIIKTYPGSSADTPQSLYLQTSPSLSDGTSGILTINTGENYYGGRSGAITIGTGYSTVTSGAITLLTGGGDTSSGAVSIASGAIAGIATGNSGNVSFRSGANTGLSNSGTVTIGSGISTNAYSGAVNITSGTALVRSGAITISSGGAYSPNGGTGSVNIKSGGSVGTGTAGNINITAGWSSEYTTPGADVNITSGYGSTNGSVYLSGDGFTGVQVTSELSNETTIGKVGFFGVTPVTKPTPTATGTGSVLSAVVTSLSNLGLLNSTGLTDFTSIPTVSVAGSTKQIQFNNAGVLGAATTATNFTYTDANSLLTLGSMLVTGTGNGNASNTVPSIGIASINSTATAGAQQITIRGGNPSSDLAGGGFPGGDVRILGGTRVGNGCKGGSVQIYAGDSGSADGTNFNQASVTIRSGYYYDAGTTSSRAEIQLDEGINNSTSDGEGGGTPATALAQVSSINLTPGYNFYGQAEPGNVNIYLPKDGADNNSRFRVYSGSTYAGGTLALEIDSAIGPNSVPTIGFYGVTPVSRPNVGGSGIGNAVSNIVTSLSNLGLISTSLTNISANFSNTEAGLVPASGSTSSGLFLNAAGTFTAPVATVTPASPTNSVQYNNAGALGGSANFTFSNATSLLTLGNLRVTGSTGTISAPNAAVGTAGQSITIQAANPVSGNVGGVYASGGSVTIKGGSAVGNTTQGAGGGITLQAGNSGSAGGNYNNTGVYIRSGTFNAFGSDDFSSIDLDRGEVQGYYNEEESFITTGRARGSSIILTPSSGASGIAGSSGNLVMQLDGAGADWSSFIVNTTAANTTIIEATGNINTGAAQLGFFGATPIQKPTITGSRSTQTVQVLADLLTALNNLGLITNSTTA